MKKRERPILMRWNHHGPVIGKWLEIKEDESGLYVEGELTLGHSVADDVYASMKHGAVSGLSIGYFPKKYTDVEDDDGKLRRELKEIELVEISIVEMPADISAQIADVKSADVDAVASLKDAEKILRDAGLSKAVSTALVSRIKSLARSEYAAELKSSQDLANYIKKLTANITKGD
jgi:HK97 family phage prohead protease